MDGKTTRLGDSFDLEWQRKREKRFNGSALGPHGVLRKCQEWPESPGVMAPWKRELGAPRDGSAAAGSTAPNFRSHQRSAFREVHF